ncbi:guanine nucleotide exchange factor DBS-like isoform X5 [Sinocyclocheilus anshuiensis]|uniref:guanine nucleotide exchange factor DBS-like isoform X4 n=1 Tax=Sinocyclocheilus anshuiensis TaxID=1608454 RepID=UPI0007B91465|nr:PREDICTED: guanine nucleotide exchange factor DBS-like isoform X4 [Sinocyclocheilus anshuiensis]XP_016346540.1 PREDICTED: guanine nucleotide exchange factor DBS-like isoform X4 [Sinocyclocheilus anshuiensis]XP_016346541.1 PREDICTED: guanine nucleotide exchange factor DBS-like isoform X5 [Sinocyclocheilus anshuiensis]
MELNRVSLLCQDITRLWLQLKVMTDEIMQQESSPLCAADISLDLRKQFAFLSGGRGQNGSPIIIFPEYPAFSELEEQEFHSVLTYLTSVPSLGSTGVGFILVIDRRQDRWASVKGTLLRIAGSFPGNLQLVLVLRPTALFQRTISDIFFKLNKDEFKMKVPVIMLSSVTELHSYIDRTQLTQELGGTQEYCHEKWISHRTAIEGFAQMVKKMAQTLQSFGTELAETELPNDVEATSNLLTVHTEKKDTMKEDLRIALCQGSRLLESINEPLVKDPDYTMNHDELENLATVQRLLGQLDETETAFDDFWDKHQTKLEQCLQLRHFEQDFREVRAHLDMVYDRVSGFSEVGISPAHVEHILKELTNHEDRACEVLDRALALACDADQLIEASHYAVDSILPKCSELRAVCEEISGVLEGKKAHLLKAMELHQCLEKATKWCDDGIYLLASQPVDKCQSQDGAESALQDMERYLETANQHKLTDLSGIWRDYESVLTQDFKEQVDKVFQKQLSMQEMFEKRRVSLKKLAAKQTRPVQPVAPRPEAIIIPPISSPAHREKTIEGDIINGNCRKGEIHLQNDGSRHPSVSDEEENFAVLRRHVMNELLETERAYVEELLCVLEGYGAEMDNPAMAHLIPNTLLHKKDILFGNMPEIYQFHKKTFLRELEAYTDYPELVGRCFLERMTDLQIYEKYCQNKPRSESLWRQCSDCAFFQECQKKLEHKLGLDSYLLKPVQRITKYQLLLKELLKYSKGCEGEDDLQKALSSILGILKAVNDSMHLIAITGYEGNLSDLGRLMMQGSFSVWTEHKKGHVKVKDLARFKPMQRHLFLHEKALLFCKKREENGEGYEKAPSYSFKHSLSMSAVGITENAKGDNKKFEIWCNSREEVYIVQASTPEIKTAWVTEIRKVLTGQLKAYREASQQKSSDQLTPTSTSLTLSPFKTNPKTLKKGEEKKTEPTAADSSTATLLKNNDKVKDETVTSPTTERAAVAKKRFTLQGFSNLKSQKELIAPSGGKSLTLPMVTLCPPGSSPPSPDHKTKRHEIKSDPTPFGFRGFSKASLSVDASEENDGYSSAEDPMNSDPEDEGGRKLSPGSYVVVADHDKSGPQELTVKSGDTVQLVREGDDGRWFVRNLRTNKEGWVTAANLLTLIGESKSSQSLSSSEGSGSGNLSTSSSCSETYTSFSDIKA